MFNMLMTGFTDSSFQVCQQNLGLEMDLPEFTSLFVKHLTQKVIHLRKTYHSGEAAWKKVMIQAPYVGVVSQQMAESWHFLRFIYSGSRSSPENQIKKCSKSLSPKLYQGELYDVIYLMIFLLFFLPYKSSQVDHDFFSLDFLHYSKQIAKSFLHIILGQ